MCQKHAETAALGKCYMTLVKFSDFFLQLKEKAQKSRFFTIFQRDLKIILNVKQMLRNTWFES